MDRDRKSMPVVFVGHGSPMNAIEDNKASREWRRIGKEIGKPKAIIAISAHWMSEGRKVRTSVDNPQIYDMYGFPEELYQLKYAPPNSPYYAKRILELAPECKADESWGIDHGVWSVLCNMYPDDDIPVVMVSTDLASSEKEQFELGKRLQPLREEGALIIASGNVVHNLRMIGWNVDGGYDWARDFDSSIKIAIEKKDFSIPTDYRKLEGSELSVPTPEHYFPLLTALGATKEDDEVSIFNDYLEMGSLSMTSYLFK